MLTVAHLCPTFSRGGGVRTYLKSLLDNPSPGIKHRLLEDLLAEGEHFDLVHVHEQAPLQDARLDSVPAIYTLHNHSTYCPSGNKYLASSAQPCERSMSVLGCAWGQLVEGCGSRRPEKIVQSYRNSRAEQQRLKQLHLPVIANSDYVRDQLLEHGLSGERVVTLRYGLPLPAQPAPALTRAIHAERRLLFAGRLVPSKGLDCLLRALALVDRRVRLDVAGEGWDQPRLMRLAERLKVADQVRWHGWCDAEQMRSLYHNCLGLVFPSVWHEPAGLVTLEAYRQRRTVIASAVGGIPEHVREGETGLLVPPNNPEKLAGAIEALQQDYEQARSMGEQGYAWFEAEFTLERHLRRLGQIYERVVSGFYVA